MIIEIRKARNKWEQWLEAGYIENDKITLIENNKLTAVKPYVVLAHEFGHYYFNIPNWIKKYKYIHWLFFNFIEEPLVHLTSSKYILKPRR